MIIESLDDMTDTFICQIFYTHSSTPQNDIIRGMTVSEDDSADPQR